MSQPAQGVNRTSGPHAERESAPVPDPPALSLIQEEFNRFVVTSYPRHLPAEHATELRRAFFAGAEAAGAICTRLVSSGVESLDVAGGKRG